MGKVLTINEKALQELVDYTSKSLVGKLLKRFEIIDDKNIVKREARELIYEEFRQLRDLIKSHNEGRELTQIKFKTKDLT